MNNGNFDTQAERYKQQLMELYSRSGGSGDKAPEIGSRPEQMQGTRPETERQTEPMQGIRPEAVQSAQPELVQRGRPEFVRRVQPEPQEIHNAEANAHDDTAYSDYVEETDSSEADYNRRFPEPEPNGLDLNLGIPDNEEYIVPEYTSEELIGTENGYILVNVRTGEESSAVEGASVSVTAVVDGKRLILASGVTDESGVSPKFTLPVPALRLSQTPDPNKRPYNLFDISVASDGFFRARSVDVPVFSGITSVQNFNLIPMPLMMNDSDEILTYYNAEPFFGGKE